MCNGTYDSKRELADDTTELDTPVDLAEVETRAAASISPPAFLGISRFWNALQDRLAAGDIAGALQTQREALDFALEPYYIGNGELDHERFLRDLDRAKGSELTREELITFGRAAGRWVARRYFTELESLPEAERVAKVLEYALNSRLPDGVRAEVRAINAAVAA